MSALPRGAPSGDPAVRAESIDAPARQTLSVVIPTYNEETNIEPTYARLGAVLEGVGVDWEMILASIRARIARRS